MSDDEEEEWRDAAPLMDQDEGDIEFEDDAFFVDNDDDVEMKDAEFDDHIMPEPTGVLSLPGMQQSRARPHILRGPDGERGRPQREQPPTPTECTRIKDDPAAMEADAQNSRQFPERLAAAKGMSFMEIDRNASHVVYDVDLGRFCVMAKFVRTVERVAPHSPVPGLLWEATFCKDEIKKEPRRYLSAVKQCKPLSGNAKERLANHYAMSSGVHFQRAPRYQALEWRGTAIAWASNPLMLLIAQCHDDYRAQPPEFPELTEDHVDLVWWLCAQTAVVELRDFRVRGWRLGVPDAHELTLQELYERTKRQASFFPFGEWPERDDEGNLTGRVLRFQSAEEARVAMVTDFLAFVQHDVLDKDQGECEPSAYEHQTAKDEKRTRPYAFTTVERSYFERLLKLAAAAKVARPRPVPDPFTTDILARLSEHLARPTIVVGEWRLRDPEPRAGGVIMSIAEEREMKEKREARVEEKKEEKELMEEMLS